MEVEEFVKSMPFFTKHYMLAIFVVTATISFNLINYEYLLLTYENIFEHYRIWTLVTNFLVIGKFSFHFLFKLFMVYYAVGSIEKYHTPNKYADFVYLIMVCMGFVWIYSLFVDATAYMSTQFILCLMYIYCKKEPLNKVRFMFGFVFKNAYLPWVLVVYYLITDQSIKQLLIGIAAGHTYIVLKDILPNSTYKYNILETPKFLQKLVIKYGPNFAANNFGGFGAPNAGEQPRRQGPQPFRFFRGQGVRLG